MNLFSIEDKAVVLTGATGYIGSYFAQALLSYGARVILVARNKEKLSALSAKLAREFGQERLLTYCVDFYDHNAARLRYEEILNHEGRVDVLVNNAFDFSTKTGFNSTQGRLKDATYEQLHASFDAGLYWAFQPTQILGTAMKKSGGGAIINIATMYAVVVPPPSLYEGTEVFNPPGYSAAKAALVQFTKYCAAFLAPEVRVNALSPGAIPNTETESANAVKSDNPVLSRLIQKTPLGRLGHPTDLTGALVFMASDASRYITGQNVVIDGGLTII